jgi:hypothetical protein
MDEVKLVRYCLSSVPNGLGRNGTASQCPDRGHSLVRSNARPAPLRTLVARTIEPRSIYDARLTDEEVKHARRHANWAPDSLSDQVPGRRPYRLLLGRRRKAHQMRHARPSNCFDSRGDCFLSDSHGDRAVSYQASHRGIAPAAIFFRHRRAKIRVRRLQEELDLGGREKHSMVGKGIAVQTSGQ